MAPLSPGSFLILGMLQRGVKTGYAIKRAVDASTRFFWAASLAQVYPELAALEGGGYIAGTDEPHGQRRRRTYKLTERGERRSWLARAPTTSRGDRAGSARSWASSGARSTTATPDLRRRTG